MSMINEFNIKDLPENSNICILGEKNDDENRVRDKLTKSILNRYVDQRKIIICSTIELGKSYACDLCDVELYDNNANQIITNLLEVQKKKKLEICDKKNIKNVTLIIDDDIINSIETKLLQEIIFYSRHYKITLIFIMSCHVSIKKHFYLRGNIDYVFLLEKSESKQRDIWPFYTYINLCFDEFFSLSSEAINSDHAIVVKLNYPFDEILSFDFHKDT